ncbi:MAG: hypothetical protein ABIK68_19100 [bacterium]
MHCLFVVNILLSVRTARFWRKNRMVILAQFDSPDIFYPESTTDLPPVDLKEIETIIFIGDDPFFHRMVNTFYQVLTENFGRNILAFIPDSRHSALTDGLGMPGGVQKSVDLIKRKQTIPMDLVRCHFIDHHGLPSSGLILNDVLIGLPLLKMPLILGNIIQWIKTASMSHFKNNRKIISLLHGGKLLYEGEYFFGLLLLGRHITKGPRIGRRLRINLSHFDYIQLNNRSLKGVTRALPDLLSGRLEGRKPDFIYEKLNELEINGVSKDNKLIADGIHIGRLPASFVLLPKAVRVISPLITAKLKKSWKGKLVTAKVPKPVGNREMVDSPRHIKNDQPPHLQS